jgi:endopeptidase La
MAVITLKDFMMNYLQFEYNRHSRLIHNFTEHIERCHTDYIINNNDRNQYLKTLSELIKNMNNVYNERLKILRGNNSIELEDESTSPIKINTDKNTDYLDKPINNLLSFGEHGKYNDEIIDLVGIWEALQITNFKHLYFDDFNEITNKLKTIASTIGFYSVEDALNILIGFGYSTLIKEDKYINFKNKLEVSNRTFIPLSYKINKSTEKTYDIISNLTGSDYEILLDNFMEVYISFPSRKDIIILRGYVKYDPINVVIRTSQICRHFIYEKKKKLTEFIADDKIKYINEKFKSLYIKNLTIGEILSFDKKSFVETINKDYEKYAKLSKMTFRNLMNDEFLSEKTSIKNQFNIIKLFLIGNSEENINMAGLLFGLTKDRKMGNGFISDIIYKNLNYTAQSRLRKSSISIKNELDKLKNMSMEEIDINKHIISNKNMPAHVKKLAIEKATEMKSGGSEYYKQKTYLDILLNFPWPSDSDDDFFKKIASDNNDSKVFIDKVKKILDDKVYGHDECKAIMQELIGKWLTSSISDKKSKSSSKAIGFYGPPGVGKTLIAKALGEALSMELVMIHIGGMEDRCLLSGHSYTYSAAQPGLIVRKMVEAGKARCIMYFDELDKACAKHGINEIFNVLIHLTDPNTNDKFNDSFFSEVSFPLNKVLFIFSYNDPDKVDKILLDRMEKIEVKPYTVSDKLVIVKNFLFAEIAGEIGLPVDHLSISDNDVEYIIENYTYEAGVRELRRKLETIYLKLNLDKIYQRGVFENKLPTDKIIISRDIIDKYLNKPSISVKKIHNNNEVGIINGLYATTLGTGGIIPIVVYGNYVGTKNTFVIKMTGSQGKVMKESVAFAFTTAMNLLKPIYREKFLAENPFGLHVHTPDGATPKDGPSAGAAFTTVFISKILNKKIKNVIAMTGEIEMNGNITAIGGLQYKIKGAQKAGVKLVLFPKENQEDLDKFASKDKHLLDDLKIISVGHIKDILKYVLIEDDPALLPKILSKEKKGRKKKDNHEVIPKGLTSKEVIAKGLTSKEVIEDVLFDPTPYLL